MEFTDLSRRVREPQVLELLCQAIGYPTKAKIDDIASKYESITESFLFGLADGPLLVALIGGRLGPSGSATIDHIATLPERRGHGLGRLILDQARERIRATKIDSETDADSVEFYRRCDFTVTSLGVLYPGIERFQCLWSAT